MAQLQATAITGSYPIGTTPYTGSAGAIWFNTSLSRIQYSYFSTSTGTILVCTP